jgi:hypothetical protein
MDANDKSWSQQQRRDEVGEGVGKNCYVLTVGETINKIVRRCYASARALIVQN